MCVFAAWVIIKVGFIYHTNTCRPDIATISHIDPASYMKITWTMQSTDYSD